MPLTEMLSHVPATGHGPTMEQLGGRIHSPHVRSPCHHLPPAFAIFTPPPSPRRLCHAACVTGRERESSRGGEREREGDVNGQCDREHMTLHLWVKTRCTLLPPAIITSSIPRGTVPCVHVWHRLDHVFLDPVFPSLVGWLCSFKWMRGSVPGPLCAATLNR